MKIFQNLQGREIMDKKPGGFLQNGRLPLASGVARSFFCKSRTGDNGGSGL